jgi:predicted ATPase
MYTRYPLMQRCQQMFLAKLHRKIHGLDRTQVAAFKRYVAGSSVASATHLRLLPGACTYFVHSEVLSLRHAGKRVL